MRLGAFFILAAGLLTTARAAIITMTITGTTSQVRVDEGPIFGYSSYQKIPDGTAFTLTYSFDDTKGEGGVSQVSGNIITQSGIQDADSLSPGINATLQIGDAAWEFGASTDSQVSFNTSSHSRSERILFSNPQSGNRVSSYICPAGNGYWPKNGDWRASFTADSLTNSKGSFSANNGRVSAKGNLNPSAIAVAGIDSDGQWLSYSTASGGPGSADWERQWHLAQASKRGGYVVQQVTRTIRSAKPDGAPITPSSVKYWEAWLVSPGSQTTMPATDNFVNTSPPGSMGSDTFSAMARFYEGLILPPSFAAGNSPYAGSRLSSTIDPHLSTNDATLPVVLRATLQF